MTAYWTRKERKTYLRRHMFSNGSFNCQECGLSNDEARRSLATVDALEKALLLCQGALIHGNHNLSADIEIALGECKRLLAALEAK